MYFYNNTIMEPYEVGRIPPLNAAKAEAELRQPAHHGPPLRDASDSTPAEAPTSSQDNEPPQAARLRGVTAADIVAKASAAAFGKPLITNVLRSMLVEAMVAEALSADWTWCSADYAAWDFQSADGIRLEVKQSAAKQTWSTETRPPSKCSFDIAARTGRYEGANWIVEPGRNAHIYVLAHHPISDHNADHRDPQQWHFYVVPTLALPKGSKTLSLARIQTLGLAQRVRFEELAGHVEGARAIMRVR